jgi:hypothetical protein
MPYQSNGRRISHRNEYHRGNGKSIVPNPLKIISFRCHCRLDHFDTNIFGDEQNIRFNVENPPYKILDYFANYKNNPNASFFVTFILKQVEALFSLKYKMYTTLLGFKDEKINENLIVLIGPLLMMYYSILILLVDFIYIIYEIVYYYLI